MSFRSVIIVVALLGTAAALGGCTPPSDDQAPITEWSGIQLNEFQQNIAADGSVSDAELRDAYERAAECIRADGWQVEIENANGGGLGLALSYGAGDDSEAGSAFADSCVAEWIGPLDMVYHASSVPQGAEREAEFAKWQQCMTTSGASVDGATLGQPQGDMMAALIAANGPYEDWQDPWALCVDKYYFTLWPEAAGSADQ